MDSIEQNGKISILAENITKRFDDLTAVDGLNLQIHEGESFALLGPDGSGKTTTMRLLCGIISPDSGTIMINDMDIYKHGDRARERIGYMPQRFSLYENLSILQNINFFSDLYNVDKSIRHKRIDEYLEFTRLKPYGRRLAKQLSGGMRQKLALICSIIHNPPILLLDEPTTGVDPVSRRDFWKILHRLLAEGLTLMISTPYMDEAERCNKIGLIHKGKILLVDTPTGLKKQMLGEVVEMKCNNPRQASDLIKLNKSVLSIQTFSDKIHIILKEDADIQEILSYLNERNINISDVKKVSPSVEDAFISRLIK
ncbi:TPA: ABC transporter ATP-binding protein [bacterium]|nr:ABC transporter ATP-binding protein [bacterium]